MNLSWGPCPPGNGVTQNVHTAAHVHGNVLQTGGRHMKPMELLSTGGTAEPFPEPYPGKPGGGRPDPTSNWLAGIRSVDSLVPHNNICV